MVRKEDVCDWFQSLPAHKRVDYMCGLLDMCLPLELRFIGTVLEDLAKKDFHYLRDQEIKANQRADLSSNNSNNLSDQKLRSKILSALALMSSTNLPCAEIIFEILQQQFDNILGLLQDKIIAADIILILTMAVHHPAFTFYQKDRLGQMLDRVDGRLRDLYGDEEEERDLVLQAKRCEMAVQPSSLNNRSQSPVSPPEKATVVAIEVISAEPSQNKKGGAEYRIRTTWSNEEVTEVLLKFKQLQDLHYKILNKFPEERKTHVSLPVFPGLKTHKEESSSDRIISLNSYFSKLTKAPAHILNCDILTEPLRSGTLIKPAPVAPATTSSPVSPFIRPERKFESASYHQPVMMPPNQNMVSHTQPSPSAGSQVSSAANSPANSRTSSPAPGRGNNSVGSMKASNVSAPGSVVLQPGRSMDQCGTISQLLQLLNLEEYYDNLKDKTFQQIMQMSKEELAMAGLPTEAQIKLKTKLDQINYKPPEMNGLIDMSRFPTPEAPNSYIYYYFSPRFQIPPYLHHPFAAHPAPIAFMPSQPLPTNEHSPANSGTPSPPPSPYEHKVGRHHMAPVLPLPVLSPPAAVAADLMDVKSMKPAGQIQQLDSSGSEEERNTGFHQEMGALRSKGHGRPQQSRSFPLISHNQLPVSALEAAKLTGMPISMSAPHDHQGLINAEIRTDNTPPLQAAAQGISVSHVSHNIGANLVNGYISDPPPVPHPGPANVIQRPILGSRTYKTAQPAHTNLGLHKNIMNMPAPDVTQTMTNLGKNSNIQIVHGNLPPQPYTLGPSVATVPPAHVMGLNQVNFPSNNIQLGPQPSPTQALLPEGGGIYSPVLMYSPRDMLTSIANSTTVMTTTSSHHSAPLSHSPSPASTTIGSEQLPVAPFHAEVHEPNRPESSSLTPPGHINSVKLQTNPGRTNSGTPSPPLIPATSKQMGHNETQPANRGHMFMPCLFPQPLPSHFHNGINSDYWRLPHHVASLPSHHNPLMYGNIFPPQPGSVHAAPNSGGQSVPTNQNHSSGGQVNSKSKCYNCGLTGHKAPECTESRMEHMSNTFHLSYKPSEPPA